MRWDVFCQVIDNFGDIGVCWRLCADLAQRGHAVRLWVDDASALAWMAPSPQARQGIEVLSWTQAAADAGTGPSPIEPGDIVIEAFGCNPPEAFVARMQRPTPPVWINLEYLSAQAWVDRNHGLRSPVFSGPGAGLPKWFFYPGFTGATGGLLREPDLLARRDAFVHEPGARTRWLARHGVALRPGQWLWSVFCYEHAPVGALLDAALAAADPVHVLLTPGPAARLGREWAQAHPSDRVTITSLPHVSQTDFDHLLWACDINFVRGEDSAVRALWAARPHVWNIYPQDDGVHADKLESFMDRWMEHWPSELAGDVRALWRTWNRVPGAEASPWPQQARLLTQPQEWARHSESSARQLARFPDLATQLCRFVASAR